MDDLLKVLANKTNQGLLALLHAEPCYARRAAALLDIQEAEVTRRLRLMENLGLVRSEWSYIGKNVKLYRPRAQKLEIFFAAEGLRVEVQGEGAVARADVEVPLEPVPDPGVVVGRDAELAALATSPVNVLEGMAGIGKSSMMAAYARAHKGTVFWHGFRGIESLNWLARHLGVLLAREGNDALLNAVHAGADLPDKRALMLDGMDREGLLVCFDDVHAIEDPIVSSFILDAATRVRKGRLCITTRHSLSRLAGHPNVQRIEIRGLDTNGARALLKNDGATADDEQLAALQERLGGHPLGLHLLAAAGAGSGWQNLAERAPAGDLSDFLLHEVDAALKEGERRILAVGSLFANGFTMPALQAVSTRIHEADLLRLQRHHLIQDMGDGYRLHEIVRSYYYDVLENKQALHKKAAAYFLEEGDPESRIEAMQHTLASGDRMGILEMLEQNVDLHEFDFVAAGYQDLYFRLLSMFDEEEVGDARQWALIEDEKGDLCFYRKDFEGALKHYQVASTYFEQNKAGTRDEDLAWKRAMALQRLGREAEAAELVAASLADAPESGLARERLEELQGELAKMVKMS